MSGSIKRKTLHDFFAARPDTAKRLKSPSKPLQSFIAHVSPTDATVPGLHVIPDFINPTEEQNLLTFLDSQAWRTDLSRRTMHYGGTYCIMPPRSATAAERKFIESTILTAPPIPDELTFLLNRMVKHSLYAALEKPEFCIVNEYKDNQGISAHVENFRFASPVCGLTMAQGDFMRFHELVGPDDGSVRSGKAGLAKRTGRRVNVWMPRRSLIVMDGEARSKWQHEIVRSRKGRVGKEWRRVSLTFRTEKTTE